MRLKLTIFFRLLRFANNIESKGLGLASSFSSNWSGHYTVSFWWLIARCTKEAGLISIMDLGSSLKSYYELFIWSMGLKDWGLWLHEETHGGNCYSKFLLTRIMEVAKLRHFNRSTRSLQGHPFEIDTKGFNMVERSINQTILTWNINSVWTFSFRRFNVMLNKNAVGNKVLITAKQSTHSITWKLFGKLM